MNAGCAGSARSSPHSASGGRSAPGSCCASCGRSGLDLSANGRWPQLRRAQGPVGEDLGLEGTLLTDILYRNMAFLNLVDPISHDQLVNLARDLQCPKTAARVQPAPEEDWELPQEQPPEDSAGGGAHEPLGNPAESTGPAAHNTLPEQPGSWAGGAGPELQRAD